MIWFIVLAFLSTAVGPFPALTAAAVLSLIPAPPVIPLRAVALFWMTHLLLKNTTKTNKKHKPNKQHTKKKHTEDRSVTLVFVAVSPLLQFDQMTELENHFLNSSSSASPSHYWGEQASFSHPNTVTKHKSRLNGPTHLCLIASNMLLERVLNKLSSDWRESFPWRDFSWRDLNLQIFWQTADLALHTTGT